MDLPRSFTIRESSHRIRWLDAHAGDELAGQMRAELATAPARHVRYQLVHAAGDGQYNFLYFGIPGAPQGLYFQH